MSRLSNKFFTGGVSNQVQGAVRGTPQAANVSTALPAAPSVRPTSSSRRGTTFAGSVAGALPNASPNEQTFGAVQSNGPGRNRFGSMGARAANQDVDSWNSTAELFNANATSAKQAEIQAYEQEVARLNSQYSSQLNSYNNIVNGVNNDYEQALTQYQQDISGYQNRQVDIKNLNDKYDYYQFYNEIMNGSNPNNYDRNVYRPLYDRYKYEFESLQQYLNQQNPNQTRFFTGTFTSDQLGDAPVRGSLPEGTSPPVTPTLPSAPSTIVEQRQMQEMLPGVINRRLANGQRELINGSLPPQVAATTGNTFSQENINYGSTPLREISQLNQQQQQTIGLPKAYRVNAGFTAQAGNNTSFGGQTFSPDQITNQTSTHYYVPGLGWTPKSNVTPLY